MTDKLLVEGIKVPELPDVKVITENISKVILYQSIKDIHVFEIRTICDRCH